MTEGLKIDVIHECKYFVSGLFIGILSSLYFFLSKYSEARFYGTE